VATPDRRALKCERQAAQGGRPGAGKSVLRRGGSRGATRRLASASRAARGLAAARGRRAAAARCLASRCRRIRRAGGRAVSAATPNRRADEHPRHGRNCQTLRKIHSFLVSSLPMRERLPWVFVRRRAPGSVFRTRQAYPGIVEENAFFSGGGFVTGSRRRRRRCPAPQHAPRGIFERAG
jgi:hypothetical protein